MGAWERKTQQLHGFGIDAPALSAADAAKLASGLFFPCSLREIRPHGQLVGEFFPLAHSLLFLKRMSYNRQDRHADHKSRRVCQSFVFSVFGVFRGV
jgi:hypothetical protein